MGGVWFYRRSHLSGSALTRAAAAKGTKRCSHGTDRTYPGEEREERVVPFCCDLTRKRNLLKRIL